MERTSLGLLFILTVSGTIVATISNLRRCGDPACKEPVSEGVTLIGYPSSDKNILSFPNNAPVIIYSKEAGSRPDLWGVEIKGKRGYVPKKYIQERKILNSKLEYEVPTEAFVAKDVESLQPDLSKEELLHNQGETVKKTSSSENPLPEIAVTAEDVEYNNLNVPGTVEEGHPEVEEKKTAQVDSEPLKESVWAEDPVNDNADTTSENVKATEEEGDKHGEEEENEEEEEELSSDDIFIEEKKVDTEKETIQESTNIFENLQDTESTTEEAAVFPSVVPESDTQSESVEQTVPHEHVNKQNSPQLESSSADFEVIDGTTIYFNEDLATATITLPDVQATATPQASAVQAENFATVDASSIHPQSSMEILQDDGSGKPVEAVNVRSSERPDSLSSTPVPNDNVQPSVVASATASPPDDLPRNDIQLESNTPTAPNLRNLVLPPDNLFEKDETGGSHEVLDNQGSNEAMGDAADDESSLITGTTIEDTSKSTADSQIETNPESSTETVSESTTELSVDKDSQSTTDLPEEEFGVPKPETILEEAGAEVEKPVENVGFFSSWFGSSESSENKDESEVGTDGGEEEEEDEDEDEVETDRANIDVESTSASEDSRTHGAEASATDTSANNVSTDFVDNPVDASDIPPSYTQATYSAEDVGPLAYNTQQPSPPSVDNSPPESAEPGNSEGDFQSPPSPAADLIPDLIDPGTGREEETPLTGGRETEPGPSTARPLYAEPLPTTPSYPAHANVDPDDMDRLAEVAGESTTQNKDYEDKINSAEGSLTEKFLKTSHNLLESLAAVLQLPEGLAFGVEAELAEPEMSSGVLVFLGVVVATIITIYTIHLCMVVGRMLVSKLSRESPMLEALNRIDRENRIITAENTSLHEQLIRSRSELEAVSSRVNESSGDISELDTQLELIKWSLSQAGELAAETEKQLSQVMAATTEQDEHAGEKAQLEEKIVQLEHELEEATTNGMEMHKMLSEMLSSQKDTSTFQASVDHLQSMLDGQREKVETLNSDLALKTRLNEELHSELSTAKERVTNLDSQVQQEEEKTELTHSLKELSSAKEDLSVRLENESKLVKDLQEVNNSLSAQNTDCDSQIASLTSELKALQDTIAQLRDSVETKDSELMVTKECLKQLRLTSDDDHATPDEEKLSSLLDVIRVKAELQRVQTERSRLKEQLQDSETAQRNLEDAMSSIRSEVTQLRSHHDQAVQDKQEALSRLAVLTKYFEEKEAQLTKELESQEGLRVDAEGAAAAGASKLQNYGLELATYKSMKAKPEVPEKPEKFHPKSSDYFNLADLSPTTSNVPVSDEYKVQLVKAKAEMRRKFSATGASNIQAETSERIPTSYPARHHNFTCSTVNAPMSVLSDEISGSSHPAGEEDQAPSSPSRPSSLSILQQASSATSEQLISHTVDLNHMTNTNMQGSYSQSSSGVSTCQTKTVASVTETHKLASEVCVSSSALVHEKESTSYRSTVDKKLDETPASDDVKSSVAKMRLLYERKELARSETLNDSWRYDSSRDNRRFDIPRYNRSDSLRESSRSFDSSGYRRSFDPPRDRGSFDLSRGRGSLDSPRDRRSFDSSRDRGSSDLSRDNTRLDSPETVVPEARQSPPKESVKVQEVVDTSQLSQVVEGKKKAQVESLRKELQDQETSYKAQLANYEQKVHENWLQARAAERRHEEQRQENSQLRTRLTMLQKERDEAHHLPSTKPHPKRVDANGSVSSPGPEGEGEGNHRDVDSPPVVPHPLAPPPMLPMMFPPGGPLPPVPPPHSLPPGVPPPPHPGLPHGVPPHGLPPPPFLSGEAPFMGPPLPPLPGDRRLPPAGGMSSPPFRRSGSPSYDHRNDRYSPASEHSHFSDHHYSPPPLRHRPGSPDIHRRNHSPDRRSDRTRSPDRRSDRVRSPDRRSNRRTPDRRLDRRSPERHYSTRSPDGYSRHRSSPHRYYDHSDFNSDETRIHSSHMKGKKTSTPLSSTDRWKTES